MEAFGAPYSMHMLELDSVGMFDTAAEEAGQGVRIDRTGRRRLVDRPERRHRRAGVRDFPIHCGICKGDVAAQVDQARICPMAIAGVASNA